ncbi:MAG: DEAD/DEAH box helicase [Candidatus Micrarchaeaceae archaeon]
MSGPYETFLKLFGRFTEIQALSITAVGGGGNCLIIAPTGSGKTEAALIPVLDRIYKNGERDKGVQAIYITPLRALNRDLMKRVGAVCSEVGITVGVRHGDTAMSERKKQSESPPALLITTPESLQNLFLSERMLAALKNVKCVIVDEVHELYYSKRGVQLAIALERLAEAAGEYQRIGLSATVGDADEVSRFLFAGRQHRVVRSSIQKKFEIGIEMPLVPKSANKEFAERFGLDSQSLARIERVAELVRNSSATIVFTNTRQVAESLGSKLIYLDRESPIGGIGVHHSSLDKDERVRVEEAFKEGKIKGIVATSSLELGIDVGRVDFVLQYGSPKQSIRLVQRLGRSGHAEKKEARGRILVAGALDAIEADAIAKRAVEGRLESRLMESGALDVAVNQICAMALQHKKISAEKAMRIISAAAPYKGMGRETFERLLAFADELKLIRYSEGFVGIGRRTMEYFFRNISVIPDSTRFSVKNLANNKVVSSLDEHFVYSYLDVGSSFISKGIPWRVVGIDGNTIYVEPSSDIEAAVPDWEGEDIPVSRTVAADVFSAFAAGRFDSDLSDAETLAKVSEFIARQNSHFSVSDSKVVVEELESYAVIYIPIGKQANELLARLVGFFLAQSSPGCLIRATPYAIVVEYGDSGRRPDMRMVFELLKGGMTQAKVMEIAAGSDLFRYKFVQVAKLFGVIEKKAVLTKAATGRLIEFYRKSVVFEEALRDLIKNSFDLDSVSEFLKGLRSGSVVLEFVGSYGSPLSQEVLRSAYHYRELLMPGLPSDRDIEAFKSSIEGKSVKLLCTYCGFVSEESIDLEEDRKYACHSCKSPMLATYREEYSSALDKVRSGRRLTKREMSAYEDAVKEAGMISAYGNRAVIAMGTYGIGLSTAARLLKYMRKDFGRFFYDLIEAQKTFVRTKKYWKR